MANTRDVMGDQACLDALVADTLTSFEDDGVKSVKNLSSKTSLIDVKLPSCTSVESMQNCTNLVTVDMLGGNIAGGAFSGCSKLTHMLLRSSSKVALANVSAFSNTPISCGDGAVYVPNDLVTTYKADNNWGKFIILPISEYPTTDFSTISDSWDDIITACGNGTYSSKYAIGDTKSIEIDGTTYYMQLVAKDSDVLASDGTTTVPTTWFIYKRYFDTKHEMNSSRSVAGGWADSLLRSWLANDVFPLLPSNVRNAVKEVKKYSGINENGVTVKNDVTADKLWIASAYEISASTGYEDTGMQFSTTLYPIDTSPRVKYNSNKTSDYWWLRTTRDSNYFWAVNSSGNVSTSYPTSSYGVAFGFCI